MYKLYNKESSIYYLADIYVNIRQYPESNWQEKLLSSLEYFPPLNSFPILAQRKTIFRGNYTRKYGIFLLFLFDFFFIKYHQVLDEWLSTVPICKMSFFQANLSKFQRKQTTLPNFLM